MYDPIDKDAPCYRHKSRDGELTEFNYPRCTVCGKPINCEIEVDFKDNHGDISQMDWAECSVCYKNGEESCFSLNENKDNRCTCNSFKYNKLIIEYRQRIMELECELVNQLNGDNDER